MSQKTENELTQSEIGTRLAEADPELIRGLNKRERERLSRALNSVESSIALHMRSEVHHSGPIPDPGTLEQYNSIIPNGAERIMIMAEEQSKHRRSLEAKVVNEQTESSKRGQIFAAILAALLIAAGTWAFSSGHDEVSGTIFGVTVVGLVAVFIVGKKQEKKSLQSKSN